jgi:hypothetical protein
MVDPGVFYTTDPLTSEWRQAAIRGLFETGVPPMPARIE